MKTYNGNVEIKKENEQEWIEKLKGVIEITGYLTIYASGTELPKLENVGGDLSIYASGTELPKLENVGGYLSIYASGTLKADKLENVGGYPSIYGEAEIPDRKKIGNKPKTVTPIREAFAKKGYIFADNILSKIISKKKNGKITTYKANRIGNKSKIVYIIQSGEVFSHGDTLKQAIHDFRYKISDRDTSKYDKWSLESEHSIADMIRAYRVITGACETGTKGWCENKKLPAKISVKLAIRLTKGAWAGNKFEKFFNKEAK